MRLYSPWPHNSRCFATNRTQLSLFLLAHPNAIVSLRTHGIRTCFACVAHSHLFCYHTLFALVLVALSHSYLGSNTSLSLCVSLVSRPDLFDFEEFARTTI